MPTKSGVDVMNEKVFKKIVDKIYSIALTKIIIGDLPRISVPEFKYAITRHGVKKKAWYDIARFLESERMGKLHGHRFFEVHMSSKTIAVVIKIRTAQARTEAQKYRPALRSSRLRL